MKHPDMIKNEYKRLLVKLDDLEDVDQIEKINKKLTDLDQRLRIVTSGGDDAKLAKPVQPSITAARKLTLPYYVISVLTHTPVAQTKSSRLRQIRPTMMNQL